MPRRARVPMQAKDTEVRIGQTWQHRWNGRQKLITGLLGEHQVVYSGSKQDTMKRTTLLRDYRLVPFDE